MKPTSKSLEEATEIAPNEYLISDKEALEYTIERIAIGLDKARAKGKEEGIKEEGLNCHRHCQQAKEEVREKAAQTLEKITPICGRVATMTITDHLFIEACAKAIREMEL